MDIINNILFGFPVMNTKIDKKSYDKKSIISTIEKNSIDLVLTDPPYKY